MTLLATRCFVPTNLFNRIVTINLKNRFLARLLYRVTSVCETNHVMANSVFTGSQIRASQERYRGLKNRNTPYSAYTFRCVTIKPIKLGTSGHLIYRVHVKTNFHNQTFLFVGEMETTGMGKENIFMKNFPNRRIRHIFYHVSFLLRTSRASWQTM